MTLLYNGVGTPYRKALTIFIDRSKELLLVSPRKPFCGCNTCILFEKGRAFGECPRKEEHGTCHKGSRPDKNDIVFNKIRTMNKSEEVTHVI